MRFIITIFLSLVGLVGCSTIFPSPTPTRSPLENRGRAVFQSYCLRCHETAGETVIVGPSLAGIGTRAGTRVVGMDAPTYIKTSILTPNVYVVDGFPEDTMPANFKEDLTGEELEAVIAYLLTLK